MGFTVARYRTARRLMVERPWRSIGALLGLLWFLVSIVALIGNLHGRWHVRTGLLVASLVCIAIGLLRGERLTVSADRYRQIEAEERRDLERERGERG
jgi:hypothetical protein